MLDPRKLVKLFFISVLLMPTVIVWAAKAPPISQDYPVDEISDGVYVIHGPLALPSAANQGFMNNPGFVLTSDGVVVIDAGSTVQVGEMVVQQIKSVTNQPIIATIATHIHGDHWMGNQAVKAAFPNVKMYAHPNMITELGEGEGDNWLSVMMTLTEGASAGTEVTTPTDAVDDSDEISIGGKTFAIIHKGKAHTNTDIMIHVKENDVYFLGDNTFNGRLGSMDDGSFKGLIETLDHAIAANAAVYVPGHGQTAGVEIVQSFRDLMDKLHQTVAVQYEEGLSDFEIKPLVVEQLKDWQGWSDFDESIGKMVSLSYLETEADAF